MIYKVGVLGASGKVGLEICDQIAPGSEIEGDYFELADAISAKGSVDSVEGVPVRLMNEPAREPVHGWIDFSSPQATMDLLERIDTPIVIGTTGFTPEQKQKIEDYSKKHPVLLSSNLSPGMNWLFLLLRKFPLPLDVKEISLLEEHHRYKKDSPSGTAKTLLTLLGSRGKIPVSVNVVRAGHVIGLHEVKFFCDEEEITIRHRVSERKIFAKGAVLALQYLLKTKKPGLYTMEDLYHAQGLK